MSAVASPALPAGAPAPAGAAPDLLRLTRVELRKATDTRAGFWLLLVLAALTVTVVTLVTIVGDPADRTFRDLFAVAVEPSAVLLPIVGILLVTSEWTQRTTLITFALVPRRGRVLAAKLLAGVALSLAALVVCLVLAALGTAIGSPGVDGAWSLPAGLLGQIAVYVVTGTIGGIAVGALLLATAPAIVLSFVLPLGWAALGSWSALTPAAEWLDSTRSVAPLTQELLSATQWARALATLALWMLLPLLGGWWRIARGEVR